MGFEMSSRMVKLEYLTSGIRGHGSPQSEPLDYMTSCDSVPFSCTIFVPDPFHVKPYTVQKIGAPSGKGNVDTPPQ